MRDTPSAPRQPARVARSPAERDLRWCWTGAATWGRVEPRGGFRGKAEGQTVVDGWGGLASGSCSSNSKKALKEGEILLSVVSKSFGLYGEGPIVDPETIRPALERGLKMVKGARRLALIDTVMQPW
jgi:hypothetical protein